MKFRKIENVYHIQSINKKEYDIIDWVIFYFRWNFEISYEACGYFDNRPRINLDLIFFSLQLILPFRNHWKDECDPPKWGIAIHDNTFWIYRGGKGNMKGGNEWWSWDIPFVTKNWFRTSILLKDHKWEHEYRGDNKEFFRDHWKQKKESWSYLFTDKYDGEEIPVTIYLEEMEWRPKWLMWTSLFAKKRRTIEVKFSKECGKEKGSWKGGATGCGYELLQNETPIDCIRRMEKEMEF